jgi:hypothetical protein
VPSELPITETVQPLFAALGGGAAVGSALGLAWAMHRGDAHWEKAAAYGSVGGALFGALLITGDLLRQVG